MMPPSSRSNFLLRRLIFIPFASLTVIQAAFAAEQGTRVLGDREFFTQGSFIAYAAPWSTDFGAGKALRHGIDYQDEITVRPETFPADVGISWHWPLTPPKETGVYGYHAISYGSYDGGIPEKAIPSRQVKAIATLTETFRFSTARPIGDFNLLTEFFLTKSPGTEEKVAEVGFFLRTAKSAVEFADAGEQHGIFTDPAGRKWKVATQSAPHGPYHMFIPEDAAEVPEGTIDFKAALDFLRAKKQITGGEWFNGLAFGIEPITGSGSLHVERLSVRYE
ncbi:hypothetical protein OVA24_13685 [Luteolibacter sp. SL250]|uniref:hypothetical protein n=1 Tax=Luteolibacter sp. SL250 TaxID=2995170 RepID=UPI0022709B83|nr:hypothetical protein [Luteolibacter sp. SL250]WAC18286.1 hypothetical protein OVA24_13685 [Luteolibacter sp. SL250]